MKTMNLLNQSKVVFLALVVISITSCNNDDNPVNEEEVFTTVITTLTNATNTITLTSRDLDGDGPNAPVVTVSGNLMANTTYTGQISFLNETETPAENINEEIEAEELEHQIFYQLPSNLGSVLYQDEDSNGNPIGLNFTLTTNNASSGNLIVTLRHELNKNASGVATGDITNAGGSTDVQVTYPIVVN